MVHTLQKRKKGDTEPRYKSEFDQWHRDIYTNADLYRNIYWKILTKQQLKKLSKTSIYYKSIQFKAQVRRSGFLLRSLIKPFPIKCPMSRQPR